MALIRQTDRRTGTVYVYEAEARWDPKRKQSRYGRRRLVGHVDPGTGEVVPNRPTRASAPSPASRREFYGACALLDAVADESGVAAAPGRALPGTWDQVLGAVAAGRPRSWGSRARREGIPVSTGLGVPDARVEATSDKIKVATGRGPRVPRHRRPHGPRDARVPGPEVHATGAVTQPSTHTNSRSLIYYPRNNVGVSHTLP